MFNKISITTMLIMAVIIAISLTANVVQAQVAIEGLISYWSFDSNTVTGNTVEDVFGNNDGTFAGDPQVSNDGKINEAIELDGAGDYISIDAPQDIPSGNDTYAIEAWFYANTTGAKGIMGWGNWGNGNQVNALRLMDQGFRHYWWGNDLDKATATITGAWHHIIAQFDGTTRALWFNGELINSDTPAGHNAQIADVNIGTTNNRSEHFDGLIDEVRLYNRGLTEAEIQQNYEATAFGAAVNPADKVASMWGKIKSQR